MALEKHFLSKRFDPAPLSTNRIVLGIVAGLLYAVSFYLLIYLVREAFRVLSVSFYYEMLILTEEEHNFYNIIYAFLAIILGQSICFKYWFERPRPIFSKKHFRIKTIVTDQLLLIWVFLFWFGKVTLAYGFMCVISLRLFRMFSLFPRYNYVFILMVVVLFLQSWSSMRIVFKRSSFKWMLVSMVIVSLLSLGLSRINPIDYKALNEVYHSKNIWEKYDIEVPESSYDEMVWSRWYTLDIFLEKPVRSDDKVFLYAERKEFEMDKLNSICREWRSQMPKYVRLKACYRLICDKETEMKVIYKLTKSLISDSALYLSYAVVPKSREYDKSIYKYSHLKRRLPPFFNDSLMLESLNKADTFSLKCRIDITSRDIFVNDLQCDDTRIKDIVREILAKDPNYLILLHCKNEVLFSDYIDVLSSIIKTIDIIRNDKSRDLYDCNFEDLLEDQKDEIRKLVPLRIVDISEEMQDFLDGKIEKYY